MCATLSRLVCRSMCRITKSRPAHRLKYLFSRDFFEIGSGGRGRSVSLKALKNNSFSGAIPVRLRSETTEVPYVVPKRKCLSRVGLARGVTADSLTGRCQAASL